MCTYKAFSVKFDGRWHELRVCPLNAFDTFIMDLITSNLGPLQYNNKAFTPDRWGWLPESVFLCGFVKETPPRNLLLTNLDIHHHKLWAMNLLIFNLNYFDQGLKYQHLYHCQLMIYCIGKYHNLFQCVNNIKRIILAILNCRQYQTNIMQYITYFLF